jgi:hypothetical protein
MGASQYISCKGNINMIKPLIKFSLIVIIAHILTYYFAGIIAQLALGAAEFYPPSPNAISYLKDPHDFGLQLWLLPTQALRGLFFAVALFPFRKRILELGTLYGGLAVAGIIFFVGFLAASGGMIEHLLFFKEYPIKFALITFVEVLIQALLMGQIISRLNNKV